MLYEVITPLLQAALDELHAQRILLRAPRNRALSGQSRRATAYDPKNKSEQPNRPSHAGLPSQTILPAHHVHRSVPLAKVDGQGGFPLNATLRPGELASYNFV